MKILLLMVALLPFTAFAEKISLENCTAFSTLAETVMTARQEGVDILTAYKVTNGNKAIEMLITNAYASPKFSTEKFKTESISEFKTKYFLYCMD